MKKGLMLLFSIVLLVCSLNVYSADEDTNNLGEVISVTVDDVLPISSDLFMARDTPVYVNLRGFTLGSFLFGEDSPDSAPFFGDLKLRYFDVFKKDSSSSLVSSVSYNLPRGNKVSFNEDGIIDLGPLIIKLRRNNVEDELPEEIVLDLTARYGIDGTGEFGIFGAESLLLTPEPNEEVWLESVSGSDFWAKRGYLRLIDVGTNRASFQLYDGSFRKVGLPFDIRKGEEVERSLPGGPSFLRKIARFKLESTTAPSNIATLVTEKDGIVKSDFRVAKGMAPFTGSSWKVHQIYPGSADGTISKKIIFVSEDPERRGQKVALEHSTTSNFVLGDPCIDVVLVNDENIESFEDSESKVDKTRLACTAIFEFGAALDYLHNADEKDEIYYNIAETYYRELKAFQMALQYYNIMINPDESVGEIVSNLERQIQDGASSISLDGVMVFLKDIESSDEKRSHFTAEVHGDGTISVDEINSLEELQSKIVEVALSKDIPIPIDLALALVEHESNFKHCSSGNSYSCSQSGVNKNENMANGEVVSTDYGLMQINNVAHAGCFDIDYQGSRGICAVPECSGTDAYDIVCNLAAGLELLEQNYNSYGSNGIDPVTIGNYCDNAARVNQYASYRGWDAALRVYNGLGCADNVYQYVENLNNRRSDYEEFEVEIEPGQGEIATDKFYVGQTVLTYRGNDGNIQWIVDGINSESILLEKKGLIKEREELVVGDNLVDGYLVRVFDINVNDNAIVTVLPGSSRSYGISDFTVTLPIEGRAIEWTPEQIDKKINKTKKTIDKLENVLDDLGKLIKAWKATCFSVYFALTVKNSFLQDPTARRLAVDDWTIKCKTFMENDVGDYSSVDDCLQQNADGVEQSIEDAGEAVEKIREYKSVSDEGLGNAEARAKAAGAMGNELDAEYLELLNKYAGYDSGHIDQLILQRYTDPTAFNTSIQEIRNSYSLDDLKTIDGLINDEMSAMEQEGVITSILSPGRSNLDVSSLSDSNAADFIYLANQYSGKNVTEVEAYEGSGGNIVGFLNGSKLDLIPVMREGQSISIDDGVFYESGGNLYLVDAVSGTSVYSNDYSGRPKVQYNSDKKPWIFPYRENPPLGRGNDEKWAYLNQANYVRVYHAANGDYDGFEIWNVGSDRNIDLAEGTGAEDDLIVVSRSQLDFDPDFNNLKQRITATYKRIDKKPNEGDSVWVQGKRYSTSYLKSRITDVTPLTSCIYHMPAKDCKILFNVCDPVMCPASRFDLGGRWKVSNVIETGIIGSLVLGWGQKEPFRDKVPICISGVHAGLDNIKSVFEGYHDCLQTAKDDGSYVGVCNEITSIYVCEMLWREALSISGTFGRLSDVFSKKFLSTSWNEGGEYSRWDASWKSLSDSTTFFTSEYARSSFAAFNELSSQEIGTEICRAAIGGKVPGAGDFLSQLTDPTSPPQFTAWFSELEHGSAERGTSSYRIYYHIYAGRDRDVKYGVFLKNNIGEFVFVTGGDGGGLFRYKNLEKGDYADVSQVVTKKSGFNEICVEIDGSEKCGFGKVTSAFSVNYLNDILVQDELGRRNITTREQCVPEHPRTTPSLGSLPTPSDYGLLDSGIIRVCAGNDPDGFADKWLFVGRCGVNEEGLSLGDCYLDGESVSFNDANRDALLGEIEQDAIERALDGEYRSEENSKIKLTSIRGSFESDNAFVTDLVERRYSEVEEKLGELRDAVRYSTDDGSKARGYNLIGKIYKSLAQKIILTIESEVGEFVGPGGDVVSNVGAEEVGDYNFFLSINDQLTKKDDTYNTPFGNAVYFDFGYEVGAQRGVGARYDIIDRYKLEVFDSNNNLVEKEEEDVWFGGNNKEGLKWKNPSRGTYTIRVTYFREDDFLSENIVKIYQVALNVGTSYDNDDPYCIGFDCAILDEDMEYRIGYNGITQWERRFDGLFSGGEWQILTNDNWDDSGSWFMGLTDSQKTSSEKLKDLNKQDGIAYLENTWVHCLQPCSE